MREAENDLLAQKSSMGGDQGKDACYSEGLVPGQMLPKQLSRQEIKDKNVGVSRMAQQAEVLAM